MEHGEETYLRQVAMGMYMPSAVAGNRCFPDTVLLLRELPHSTIDDVDVRFVDITGCEFILVNGVYFGVPPGMSEGSFAASDFRVLFGHALDLTSPRPRPRDSFMMMLDGYLLPTEELAHRRARMPPLKPEIFHIDMGVPRCYITAPATPQVRGHDPRPSSHIFETAGYFGSLRYSFTFHVDHTRRNLIKPLVLGMVEVDIGLRSSPPTATPHVGPG